MFKEQVTTDIFVSDILYLFSTIGAVAFVLAIGIIDAGLSRRGNVLDNWVGKLTAAAVGVVSFSAIGYGVWEWQFNQAFGVENGLWEAIKAWWIGGPNLTALPQSFDPATNPTQDVFVIFFVFFAIYAGVIGAFIHSIGLERMTPRATYISVAVVCGLVWPFLAYLTYGSLSPLTNAGTHDFLGTFNFYIFLGVLSLVLVRGLGPRSASSNGPHDYGMIGVGVTLILAAAPVVAIGSLYLVPGQGVFGIAMSSTGFGLVVTNVFFAFAGGTLAGSFLAYRQRQPMWALFGGLSGLVATGTLLDVGRPWQLLLVGLAAPFVMVATSSLITRTGIDDTKFGVVYTGPAIFGALATGFLAWGEPTGGFFGLEGKYAFQGAEITPWWQLAGVGTGVGFALVTGFVLVAVLKATGSLRNPAREHADLDRSRWDVVDGAAPLTIPGLEVEPAVERPPAVPA